jgi:uncharacterized protein (TIGR02996 family)
MRDAAEPFLRAILEHPDDDGPRLVYADWLDKQGDTARAEFIRVQCRLASLGPNDPERERLVAREQELIRDHGELWRSG